MADRKISDLTALTTPAAGDYLPIVDISEASAANKNKRITIEELLRGAPDGTAAAPSIAFESDPNTGIYSSGADQLSIATNGTERLRIDSTGQIEAVSLGTAAAPTWSFTGDPNTGIYSPGADQLAVATNGTGRLFVDASGLVGIGASTPDGLLTLAGANSNTPRFRIQHPSSDRDAAISTYFDGSGTYLFVGSNHYVNSSGSNTKFDATSGSSAWYLDGSGLGIFYNSSGSGSITERLRIRADGTFEIKGGGTAGTSPAFSVNPSAPANSFVMLSDGKVGLGTSSPGVLLESRITGGGGTPATSGTSQTNGAIRISGTGTTGVLDIGCNSAAPWIQSTDRTDLSQKYDLLLNPNGGRVGVGTSSPTSAFHVSGTNSTPAVFERTGSNGVFAGFKDASGNIVYLGNTNGVFSVQTAGSGYSDKLVVTSAGNVGIGTTSPDVLLTTRVTSGPIARFRTADTNFFGIDIGTDGANQTFIESIKGGSGSYQPLAFWTGGSQRAAIDTSGRLLVGTSSARANFYNSTLTSLFQVESAAGTRLTSFTYGDSGNSGPIHVLAKHRSASVGGTTVVAADDQLGTLSFQGSDGTEFVAGAEITAYVDGTPGSNDMPGRIVLSTTADGASSPTERLRITSTGQVRLAGAGITFNGDTATANELDDYEEGIWTPAITGSTTAGTVGYDNQVGKYTKIGRQVTVSCNCDTAVVTTAPTGNIRVSGLPFTPSAGSEFIGAAELKGIPFPASTTYVVVEGVNGQTYVEFYGCGSNAATGLVQADSLATDDYIRFTLTYFV